MAKEKETTKMSFSGGVWFYFEDNGNVIALNGSAYSGKEVVYVNDKLVSKKWTFSFLSKHSFTIDQDSYVISVKVTNVFTGTLLCTLFKNDKEIDNTIFGLTLSKLTLNPKKSLSFYIFIGFLLLCACLGGIVGYGAGQLASSLATENIYGG